ncbi:DMT family transporter [Solirubrobacter phytolaccae]|uniref:DMT family transporter n=1 Tax=Solirubrobacter phytolaccae TaxID=1404360 RepID=A0A9X3NGN6_9ACTN|nr:DMT family transporter [Solirubrobacter phytolaccae]MDA0185004.1 DMT family transporter [Solirubrobacter phytolaccae]
MIPIPLALGAALLFAAGSALQQRAARTEAGSLVALARRPVWLAGLAADGLGYVGQAAALAVGRLAVVQPVLASSLVFAVFLQGRRVRRVELLAALCVAGGLAAFLVLADPVGGRDDASVAAWCVAFGAALLACLAARGGGAVRLGCATGVLFGLSAALTKAVVERLDEGVLHALLDWHVVALVIVGWASMELSQRSLRAGALGPAVASQMALDALTSVAIGVLAFGERLHTSAAGFAFALLGLAAMVAGLAVLAAAPEGPAAPTDQAAPTTPAAAAGPAASTTPAAPTGHAAHTTPAAHADPAASASSAVRGAAAP